MKTKSSDTKTIHQLNRIKGQIESLSKVIEDGSKDCKAIATQLLAVSRSFDSVRAQVVSTYFENCLSGKTELSDDDKDFLKKLIKG